MKGVTQIVNSIREKVCVKLSNELEAAYGDLLYHTEMRALVEEMSWSVWYLFEKTFDCSL